MIFAFAADGTNGSDEVVGVFGLDGLSDKLRFGAVVAFHVEDNFGDHGFQFVEEIHSLIFTFLNLPEFFPPSVP